MSRQVLFIQGGGDSGYEADKALVVSLQNALGKGYVVHYPIINTDETAPDFGWVDQIGGHIAAAKESIILVGHSFGASMIIKYLSEHITEKKMAGIFLMATPFWNGNEKWKEGLKLSATFAEKLNKEIPIFFYHCRDDEEIPFSDLALYKEKLSHATIRVISHGGHQLGNDLRAVAQDIILL